MNGRPFSTLQDRTWPSAVTTQRTRMLPSTPRSSASGVYSGTGPETIEGKVMLSLNSTANVNASTARRIDPVFTAKKSSRIASDDKKSSLELREDGPLHQIRRQQALRQDRCG